MPNLTILTGAGVSADSGIATFRASNGTWMNHNVTDVATPEGFKKNPDLVHAFYNSRREDAGKAQPNPAHEALARLEREWSDRGAFLLVTQNVDDLHRRAGSVNVAHMHGEIDKVVCTSCHEAQTFVGDVTSQTLCSCGQATLRPDVVWFGEMPKYLDELEAVLDRTDIYVSIGTSGSVMPASLFGSVVRQANPNAEIIEVNLDPVNGAETDKLFTGPAKTTVPEMVDYLLEKYR